MVVCRVGEGHGAVVIGTRFSCQKSDMVDASNGFVDVTFALAAAV